MFGRTVSIRRVALVASIWSLTVVTACAATAVPQGATPERTSSSSISLLATPSVGQSVWVDVAVATLWVTPTSPRPVDAPALSNPVHIATWLKAMSTSTRRGLVGRVETQSLYGERLLVTGVRTGWLHVVAVTQPTHRDSRGYPGWVPLRQVTTHRPISTTYVATVIQRLAPLRTTTGTSSIWVSFGTRLPVLVVGATRTTVYTPTGQRRTIANTAVVRRLTSARPLPLTASSVLASARLFVGTPYLWGARSGWAVDCSGFTNIVYGVHGVRLPRDADDQARRGSSVAIGAQRPSDLVFYKEGTATIVHVGFSAGGGVLLHAPHTGAFVGTASVTSPGAIAAIRRFV
ncbi:MAG TPA: NlpC/P60 family protein [Mycobacteriales bacterium]|nr:NlpC/P60 family protein [Mycobacteriales bacterium]